VIIAFVVFWIGKAAARLIRKEAAEPTVPPPPTRAEVLLQEIRDRLPAPIANPVAGTKP
jgi:large conductance mechanosensitive channel